MSSASDIDTIDVATVLAEKDDIHRDIFYNIDLQQFNLYCSSLVEFLNTFMSSRKENYIKLDTKDVQACLTGALYAYIILNNQSLRLENNISYNFYLDLRCMADGITVPSMFIDIFREIARPMLDNNNRKYLPKPVVFDSENTNFCEALEFDMVMMYKIQLLCRKAGYKVFPICEETIESVPLTIWVGKANAVYSPQPTSGFRMGAFLYLRHFRFKTLRDIDQVEDKNVANEVISLCMGRVDIGIVNPEAETLNSRKMCICKFEARYKLFPLFPGALFPTYSHDKPRLERDKSKMERYQNKMNKLYG